METGRRRIYIGLTVFFGGLLFLEFVCIPFLLQQAVESGRGTFRVSQQGMLEFVAGWMLVFSPIIIALVFSEIAMRISEWVQQERRSQRK